jgi:tRNA modification GTPase
MGIERTGALSKGADLVIFMLDADRGVFSEDHELYERIQNKEIIVVINKMDLIKDDKKVEVPKEWSRLGVMETAVKYGLGTEELKEAIYRFGTKGGVSVESDIVPNLRQKQLFEKAYNALGDVGQVLEESQPAEIAAMELKKAMDALDEITGDLIKTDVLDTVFSRFCIGK